MRLPGLRRPRPRSLESLVVRTSGDRSNNKNVLAVMTTVSFPLLLIITLLYSVIYWSPARALHTPPLLSRAQLETLIENIKGDDTRMVRWDATKHTSNGQSSGLCDAFPDAIQSILSSSVDAHVKGLACEYLTFCITDNPTFRALLGVDGNAIFSSIVSLVASETSSYASAMASHLIYIASFSNAHNHEGFYQAGAVPQLARIIHNSVDHATTTSSSAGGTTHPKKQPVQIMWAAAALQNLAASYCNTPDDGRCYWDWRRKKDHVVIDRDSLPLISDGAPVRQQILQEDPQLIDILVALTCQGPVEGEMSKDNVYPGDNAQQGVDDNSPNIVAWAAAGALKNLALEPAARARIEPAVKCLCYMAHSEDWLEANKGEGALQHLRRDDPCWFPEGENEQGPLCVDRIFYDAAFNTCSDYGGDDTDCDTIDSSGVSAKDACCACDGGDSDRPDGAVDEF